MRKRDLDEGPYYLRDRRAFLNYPGADFLAGLVLSAVAVAGMTLTCTDAAASYNLSRTTNDVANAQICIAASKPSFVAI